MTPFTDNDLKRLKREIRANRDYPDNGDLLALIARLEAHEQMSDYIAHEDGCVRNRNSQGRPVADGGYECMYDGKWYRTHPVDETPKCNCGLDEKYETWRKAAGK